MSKRHRIPDPDHWLQALAAKTAVTAMATATAKKGNHISNDNAYDTGYSKARQQNNGTAIWQWKRKGNDNAKGRSTGNIYSNSARETNL